MSLDTALVGALHLESLKKGDISKGHHPHHSLFQTSTIEALLDGNYDGDITFRELREMGDFGLGTLDALDGEMITLDAHFYQMKPDGRAYPVDDLEKTPFAVVTFFEPEPPLTLAPSKDIKELYDHLDRLLGDPDICCAVRIDAHFEYVKTRSVPRQHRPYPPLVEVVKTQTTSEFHGVSGSLVGFRFPDDARGLNVPGYHFHFITDDRSAGGHLLECRLTCGEMSIDRESDLRLELPPEIPLPKPGQPTSQDSDLDLIEKDG